MDRLRKNGCDLCSCIRYSYGTLYSNSILGKLTYFSVGLFVLLSGVSSFISLDNKIDAGGTKREIYLINT